MGQAALLTATNISSASAIDRVYLDAMTFGDEALKRELLQLFDRQAEILLARMRTSDAGTVATLAHTLKGSAVGIGAGAVAEAAAALEAAAAGSPRERAAKLDALGAAVAAARGEITALLRA
ncbi:MAG TPA: Hpt domain-containing protein [Pseudolabrys sp.]|nr:Hpt domain-containing protein [Pseudolabrys sp.]